jgi:hypothetical protein
MSNVTDLFPKEVSSQETIMEFLQNMEFDNILVLAKRDGIPFMLTTFDSLEETNLTIDEIKFSLIMGDTEEV